jgi:transcriptional regulator with GAF, ATPase, and Fis domain
VVPLSPDGAVVTVVSGPASGAWARLPARVGEQITVGKATSNELVLSDPTVSRKHLAIARTSAGLEVRDLDSTNGVHVGGAQIKSAIVEPGTLLRAGDVELLIGVLLDDVAIPPSPDDRFGLVVGSGLEMRRIFGVLQRIARTPANVFLIGETGTGKDAIARSIHLQSSRADGPFEVVDCGAIAGTLIESELFGHERGAFTGAVASRAGAFERAAGGTLFLDEIGELERELQPKLLRVLEAREFRRVGGERTLRADVRIVAATTRDLAQEHERGAFREDLYFRLAVVTITVPPLRARRADIAQLAPLLLEQMGLPLTIDAPTLVALRSYDWPGNVRELRNVLERAAHLSTAATTAAGSGTLTLADFPPSRAAENELDATTFDERLSYREIRARFEASFEQRYVRWLLGRHDGNVAAAAREARMDRNHLTDLARRHDVDRRRR